MCIFSVHTTTSALVILSGCKDSSDSSLAAHALCSKISCASSLYFIYVMFGAYFAMVGICVQFCFIDINLFKKLIIFFGIFVES